MNFLASLMLCQFWMSVNAHGLQYLDANVPDLAQGVTVSVNITFDPATSIFSYTYLAVNSSKNTGTLTDIALDVSQPPGAAVFADTGLGADIRFSRASAEKMLASGVVNIVPIVVESPMNWDAGIGLGNVLRWASIDQSFDVQPSSGLSGYVIRSHAPPGVRSFVAQPFLNDDALPDDQFNGDVAEEKAVTNTDALLNLLKVSGTTLGPTPPASLDPENLIDALIALKHQSVSLGWLRGDEFIKDLDEKLDQAKEALSKSHDFQARKKLEQFIGSLDDQRRKQEERRRRDHDRNDHGDSHDRREPETFLSGNAYNLLKPNAEFILSKLPKPADKDDKDRDSKDDAREPHGN